MSKFWWNPAENGGIAVSGKNVLVCGQSFKVPRVFKDPQDDPRNVAFYKKRQQQQKREEEPRTESATSQMKTEPELESETKTKMTAATTTTPSTSPTWASVATMKSGASKSRHLAKISPLFESEKKNELSLTYDRIVVSPTHFNNRKFSGYLTLEDSEVIRKAIGLETEVFHGTSFDRSDSGELSITFRLKTLMSEEKIKNNLNSHFWFEKWSKEGTLNKIKGCVIYPMPNEGDRLEYKEKMACRNITEIKIEGSNYELKESHITNWLHLYGAVESNLEEEAVVLGNDDEAVLIGTGSYLVKVNLKHRIPNVIPMQGKKIRIWYSGVKIQCRTCYGYHKKEPKCENKISFDSYTSEFKKDNPDLPDYMFSLEGDEFNGENSEEEGVKDISNDLNNNHNDFDNNNNDEFSFLDTSQEKGEEEEEKETKCDKALKEAEVEDWTLEELGTYLLTFTPTEEETVWFKMLKWQLKTFLVKQTLM